MILTLADYFGRWINHPDATPERKANAMVLMSKCAELQALAESDGVMFRENPCTECGVSGEQYGGFRPQACPEGAPHSSHKEGMAVDRYDPDGKIDEWCMANFDKLAQCDIYIEHPDSTKGWSHWTIRAPASGHRAFYP